MRQIIKLLLDGKFKATDIGGMLSIGTESGKKYPNEWKSYQLWIDYLKRSNNYKLTCNWFKEAAGKYPFPGMGRLGSTEMVHNVVSLLTTLQFHQVKPAITFRNFYDRSLPQIKAGNRQVTAGDLFIWAYDNGFPFKDEMLINYAVFGDTFDQSSMASSFRSFRLALLIELHRMSMVFGAHETIRLTYAMAEMMFKTRAGREPTVDEFKDSLSLILENDFKLYITIANPFRNKEEITNIISEIIEEERKKRERVFKNQKAEIDFFEPGRFELPGSNLREDELTRYLKAFDLKTEGKTTKEIARIVHPEYNKENIDSAIRATYRDLKNATTILKNVEDGFFPGKY
jgi:hypothetical protein